MSYESEGFEGSLKRFSVELQFDASTVDVEAFDEEDALREALGLYPGLQLIGSVVVEHEPLPLDAGEEDESEAPDAGVGGEQFDSLFDSSSDDSEDPLDFIDDDCDVDYDDSEDPLDDLFVDDEDPDSEDYLW